MSKKVFVIGRHTPDLGDSGYEIVATKNITFPVDWQGTEQVLRQLTDEAKNLNAAILLQNCPAPVLAVLTKWAADNGGLGSSGDEPGTFGIIVSIPGERPAGVVKTFQVAPGMESIVTESVTFANPNAKVIHEEGMVTVVVDPPQKFKFSHVQWL